MPIFHQTHTATAADTGALTVVTVTREDDLTTAVVSDADLSGDVVLESSLPPPLLLTDREATDLGISLVAAAHRGDRHLVETLLRDWPDDVASEPLPDLVDLDTAMAAVRAGRWSRRFRQVRDALARVSRRGRHRG